MDVEGSDSITLIVRAAHAGKLDDVVEFLAESEGGGREREG